MRWLKTKVREWLGIHEVFRGLNALNLESAGIERLLRLQDKAHEDLVHRINHLSSFFGQLQDDEPVTRAELSTQNPWDAT